MESAFVAGRVILGSYFLYSAFNHFTHVSMMSGYAASKGVPAAPLAIVVSGLLLAIAGVTFLLGWQPKLGVAALVLFLVPVTFIMHAFWKVEDPMMRSVQDAHFMKNMSLAGRSGALRALQPRRRRRLDDHGAALLVAPGSESSHRGSPERAVASARRRPAAAAAPCRPSPWPTSRCAGS